MDSLAPLADPPRRRIVEMLAHRELSAGEIADHFAASAPALSQHLKVLRGARLVRGRAGAPPRLYQLRPGGVNRPHPRARPPPPPWRHPPRGPGTPPDQRHPAADR